MNNKEGRGVTEYTKLLVTVGSKLNSPEPCDLKRSDRPVTPRVGTTNLIRKTFSEDPKKNENNGQLDTYFVMFLIYSIRLLHKILGPCVYLIQLD